MAGIINENIKFELGEIFARNTPSYPDLDEAIEFLWKIIYHLTQDRELNGLNRALPSALQEAFIDKIGDINALSIIAEKSEPFLKK